MTISTNRWTRSQLLVALDLYTRLPFGQLHSKNPEIVRCAQAIVRSPSALAMKLSNIASLDPVITSSGRSGLKSASALDRSMWDEMHSNWDQFILDSQKAKYEFGLEHADVHEHEEFSNRLGTDVEAVTNIRVGQGFFRRTVLSAYDGRCCVTGLAIPALLIASHIVPWREDPSNRVNPKNGLLLSALHDRAFDAGFMTVDENFKVRVSQSIPESIDPYYSRSIGIHEGQPIRLPNKFIPDEKFLDYHRAHVFRG